MSRDSKFLSLLLRQKPEEIDLKLEKHGWVDVGLLLRKLKKAKRKRNREELIQIVEANDKERFTLSEDGLRIRAAQGHSIDVDLGLQALRPPIELYHGTDSANLDAIFVDGLNSGRRQQVHLLLNPNVRRYI